MADLTTAARPYARAAFESARDSSQFEHWSDALEMLSGVVADDTMAGALDSPGLTSVQRYDLIEKVAGDKLNDSSRNFVKLLSENNRLSLLPDIVKIFNELRSEAEGEIEAQVVSAFDLDDSQRNKIAEALAKRLNRKIRIVNTVDPDLLGGAIVKAGDLVIDGSIKGRLTKMTQSLGN